MKLILIRHGETEENVLRIFSDVIGGTLTANGEIQATELGVKLKNIKPKMIFCSPAKRCKRTLEMIMDQTKWNCPIEYEMDIRERNYGILIGQMTNTISRQQRETDSKENDQMGIERHEQVKNRISDFLNKIKVTYSGDQTVVVVSHGDPLVWMCAIIDNIGYNQALEKYKVKNGEAIEFTL